MVVHVDTQLELNLWKQSWHNMIIIQCVLSPPPTHRPWTLLNDNICNLQKQDSFTYKLTAAVPR